MLVARRALTLEDRLAATEIGHDAAPPETRPPLELFQAVRLRLARRARGAWWLLEEDERPVSTLVCYPLEFAVGGTRVPGYGIGAVATRKDTQRRGHAHAICRAAIEGAESAGRHVGLLFSAIPPALYERLRFAVAPAWGPVCERPADLAVGGPRARLLPTDPRGEAPTLVALYEAAHDGLHLSRDVDEWRRTVELNPTDEFFALGDPPHGYVRLCFQSAEAVEVVECAVPSEEAASVLRAVADLAVRAGRKRIEGWFEPVPEVAPFFRDRGRATTLPMVRGHSNLAHARFWSSDYF